MRDREIDCEDACKRLEFLVALTCTGVDFSTLPTWSNQFAGFRMR